MSALRITLFGRLRCTLDDQDLKGLDARKVQELFIYLLLHRARPCTRDALATLLWGERATAQAKKNLRQTLWQLQGALDGAVSPNGPLLCATAEWVEINPAAGLWLDVEHFERAYAATRQVADHDLAPDQVTALRRAVELYDGDLLEGWYHDWCIFERERLQGMYLAMLDKLVAYAERTADFATAVHYCELSLRCDPARERTHRRLMRLHALAGNRTAALRQFDLCREMLANDLGVAPAQSTVSLYERIRQDHLGVDEASQAPADAAGVGDILRRLRTVHATLAAALDQVQQDIEAVERLIQRTR